MNTISTPQHTDTLDDVDRTQASKTDEIAPKFGRSLGELSPAVITAANWIAKYGDTIKGAPVPVVRAKFGLSPLEAVDALRHGRVLRDARTR